MTLDSLLGPAVTVAIVALGAAITYGQNTQLTKSVKGDVKVLRNDMSELKYDLRRELDEVKRDSGLIHVEVNELGQRVATIEGRFELRPSGGMHD